MRKVWRGGTRRRRRGHSGGGPEGTLSPGEGRAAGLGGAAGIGAQASTAAPGAGQRSALGSSAPGSARPPLVAARSPRVPVRCPSGAPGAGAGLGRAPAVSRGQLCPAPRSRRVRQQRRPRFLPAPGLCGDSDPEGLCPAPPLGVGSSRMLFYQPCEATRLSGR